MEGTGLWFEAVRDIPLDCLQVSRAQSRTRDVEKNLDELVQNIRTHGQLEPIVVARIPESDKFEIITGQRRYLAHKRLGRETILAAILPEVVDEATATALSISENLIRVDLNPKDLIDACTSLYRKYGSVKAVAEELGVPYQKVLAYVKYDRLSQPLRQTVDTGDVDMQTALRRSLSSGALAEDSLRVVQVVVTLSAEVHAQLQRWARCTGTSQDEAAAPAAAVQLVQQEGQRVHLRIARLVDVEVHADPLLAG